MDVVMIKPGLDYFLQGENETMQPKQKIQTALNTVSSLLTQVHANSGGAGQSQKESRPARFFPEEKKSHKGVLRFWRGVGEQVNDNASIAKPIKMRLVGVAVFFFVAGILVSLNGSTIATQAVIHAPDKVLETAMNVSPDALAYVLNKANIGE